MSAALLDAYAEAWASMRTDAIASFWAPENFRFYKAEEIREVFTTWEDVLAYWHANEAHHAAVRLRFSELQPLALDGPWSLLWCAMRWDIRFADDGLPAVAGKAMGGDNKVLALLHGERLAGWSETPDAAITYIRALYEQQAEI
jgi:hypothetical protein